MHSTLSNFTLRKRKPYDTNDLSLLSLVSIIAYIYSFGKKFHCAYLKTAVHEMILYHAKPSNEKMPKHLVKICKER